MAKPKTKTGRKWKRGVPGSENDPCNPGVGWHMYDGSRLSFILGVRWVSRIFIAPHLSIQSANEALGLSAEHVAALKVGAGTQLGEGWVATAHHFRKNVYVVLTDSVSSCAYIARPSDFNRTMGLRIRALIPV